MVCVALFPVVLSVLALCAHFLRAGQPLLVLLYLAVLVVLPIRSGWSARLVQGLLILGALEWVRVIPGMVGERQELGLPWVRMAVIMVAVALFTTASAAVFRVERVRRHYGLAA